MSAKVLTLEEAQTANLQVVNDGSKGNQAVHDVIVAYQANRRTGSANTKTRSEIRGNTKKMYRQKGTGNARHGDKKAPIFVGGGVVFGPKPRDYGKTVPKKIKKLALRRALGSRISAGEVKVVPNFSIADGKTKNFVKALREVSEARKVIVVAEKFDEETYRAGRNVAWAQLETADSLNVEQIVRYDEIILVEDCFETLARRTA